MSIKSGVLWGAKTKTFVGNVNCGWRWGHSSRKCPVELYNMQKNNMLHLANKWKSKIYDAIRYDIHWYNAKMKAAVAAQTLSNSVASGIRYLKSIAIPRVYWKDKLSVLHFKSKRKFGTHYKTPITLENIDDIEEYLNDVNSYLEKPVWTNGWNSISKWSKENICFCFALSSKSIITLAKRLLERDFNRFNYLLTRRFSQDRIQMFFSKIGSRLG